MRIINHFEVEIPTFVKYIHIKSVSPPTFLHPYVHSQIVRPCSRVPLPFHRCLRKFQQPNGIKPRFIEVTLKVMMYIRVIEADEVVDKPEAVAETAGCTYFPPVNQAHDITMFIVVQIEVREKGRTICTHWNADALATNASTVLNESVFDDEAEKR